MALITYATKAVGDSFTANDANEIKTVVNENAATNQTYTSYTALLNQSGTSAPIATILSNNTDYIFTYEYVGVGQYQCAVDFGATVPFILGGFATGELPSFFEVYYDSNTNLLVLNTYNASGVAVDDALINTAIEIRIYP